MNTLATSLLFACAGVLLTWLLRRPVRCMAGPGPAFSLWLLPPLLAIIAWLRHGTRVAISPLTCLSCGSCRPPARPLRAA